MKELSTFLMISLVTLPLLAADLECIVEQNGQKVFKSFFSLSEKGQEKIGDFEGHRLYIKNLGFRKFEIEVFDASSPQRTYATGFLSEDQHSLRHSLWSREILLEVDCKPGGRPAP